MSPETKQSFGRKQQSDSISSSNVHGTRIWCWMERCNPEDYSDMRQWAKFQHGQLRSETVYGLHQTQIVLGTYFKITLNVLQTSITSSIYFNFRTAQPLCGHLLLNATTWRLTCNNAPSRVEWWVEFHEKTDSRCTL